MFEIDQPNAFNLFKESMVDNLRKMDYNFQKDMMEYSSPSIKERVEERRKMFKDIWRKIDEVKEYSVKIIEVAMEEDDS